MTQILTLSAPSLTSNLVTPAMWTELFGRKDIPIRGPGQLYRP